MHERIEAPAHARAQLSALPQGARGGGVEGGPGRGPGGSVWQMLQTVGLFSDMLPTRVCVCQVARARLRMLFNIAAGLRHSKDAGVAK